ncbi:MAG TPA: hypothetical protein VG713_12890 [Pirellulales bacterium]|nr:hypothetical protein [Pirellulales bacterium]
MYTAIAILGLLALHQRCSAVEGDSAFPLPASAPSEPYLTLPADFAQPAAFLGDPHGEQEDEPQAREAAGKLGLDNGKLEPWPNISQPGPDMGDAPNSAYTLPKGGAQIEFSPATLLGRDRQSPPAYAAPFLLRYGLTDDVEFRVFGNGYNSIGGVDPFTGVSPPNLDMKVHLWDDAKKWLLPAASLEVYLTTTWGTPAFSSGWQPSINMNFDLPVTERLNLEWTLGYSGVQQALDVRTGERFVPRFNHVVSEFQRIDSNAYQFSVQWAVEYQVTDRLDVFVDGFHNGALHLNVGSGDMVGQGIFWKFNYRFLGFASVSEGLTPNIASIGGQVGFAYAL